MADEKSFLDDDSSIFRRRRRELIRTGSLKHEHRITEEMVERARQRKARTVYENFISEALEEEVEEGTTFDPDELNQRLRPPYSTEEVRNALEYGESVDDSLHALEEGEGLFMYELKQELKN